jgi:hypothetical protein
MRDYEVGDTVEYQDIFGQRSRAVVRAKRRKLKHERAGFEGVEVGTGDPVWGYDDQITYVVPANAVNVEWPDEASAEGGDDGSTKGQIEMFRMITQGGEGPAGPSIAWVDAIAGSGRSSASTGGTARCVSCCMMPSHLPATAGQPAPYGSIVRATMFALRTRRKD